MKTPTQVLTDLQRRLDRTWHTDLTGQTHSWPYEISLSAPAKADLEANWAEHRASKTLWQDWARQHNLTLTYATRDVHGTRQQLPTHLPIPDQQTAARLAAAPWPTRLTRAATRLPHLTERLTNPTEPARLLRATIDLTDVDFTLLLTVADWVRNNPTDGLTPRQVPIPGVHAKWLNARHTEVLLLSGRDTLGLLPPHPSRIHFTYLDPTHRAAGHRRHDSATVGDTFTPAYTPHVVLISENKDTALHFPPTPAAISVEGDGYGGKATAAFPWITQAPHLYYWGDLDAHGFEILSGWRADGVPVTSLLMDLDTYTLYEKYGTNLDRKGQPLTATRRDLPHLTPDEQAVYDLLTDPTHTGHRRIEQERIPLHIAHQALTSRL